MNAVGIDVSKGKSMVAVMQPLGVVAVKPFGVQHTAEALENLGYSLKELPGETRVIMEHTGRYYEPVAQVLHGLGLFVSAVNPILISEYGNNALRHAKTDKKDALKIAKYGLDNWAGLREYTPMEAIRQQLKNASRQLDLYAKIKVALTNNLIALLDQMYPGANTFFDSPVRADGHQKWVDFIAAFWHADCVSALSERAFSEKYRKWCKRRGYNFSAAKASDVYIESLGHIITLPKNASTKRLIQQAIAALNTVSTTAESFRAETQRLARLLPEYPVVMAMYGVGDSLGPKLIAEIGDVRRFANKRALVAYAGIDPEPSQSGKRNTKSNAISRKGVPAIRKAVYLIMGVLLQNAPADEPVYQFLDKKRSEGKPYFVYMTAASNKLLRIYYARVKEYLDSLESTDPA